MSHRSLFLHARLSTPLSVKEMGAFALMLSGMLLLRIVLGHAENWYTMMTLFANMASSHLSPQEGGATGHSSETNPSRASGGRSFRQ